MTQDLINNRKRLRNLNCDEECCDFMPLSKRINNLHINTADYFSVCNSINSKNGLPSSTTGDSRIPWVPVEPLTDLVNNNPVSSPLSVPLRNWDMEYNPDLSASENPYYFEKNKLLFELYVQRLIRGGHPHEIY